MQCTDLVPPWQPCWCVSRCSDHPAGSSVAVPASPAERPGSFSLCQGPLTWSASESVSLSAGANGPPAPPDRCCSEPYWSASRRIVKFTINILKTWSRCTDVSFKNILLYNLNCYSYMGTWFLSFWISSSLSLTRPWRVVLMRWCSSSMYCSSCIKMNQHSLII